MPAKQKKSTSTASELIDFEGRIDKMSKEELKELFMLSMYKLVLTRAQVEAIAEILIKNRITTYDEIWKKTNEIVKDSKLKYK